ncbi:U3 small nucleolar RNA-associated protein 6-like [Vitis vinifera]|uniref:U3 small nucleolar RNA-associated protein 6-like n=1 Tax=Vitis vinifera TaxID=29760 RepID=A0A438EEL8_VITVI|nr:U3 small nucleolar RNA-associated protein 6-like [Vitis vinifera]
MADVVQYRLERMVNELDDLERRGVFSRREIAEIVKQRRKFEYRLKRPSPLKQDYLAYIEYEKQLDSLRRLRKKSVAREAKKKTKKSVSDFAGVSRILEIYQLAVMRYKGDIDLWFRYLEFCRERRNGRMKKVLAQVIRFHPKVPGVWIYAAAWEFDHNLNATAARALMQSGLRVCPTSEDLWVEYLRMELTYLNKLKARKVALGEDEGTLINDHRDADEKQWREENKDLFMSLDEERGSRDVSNRQNEESKKKSDMFQEQGLSILRTIYSGAVEAIPSRFSLRTQFFEILEAINLAGSKEMQKEILSDMKRDFSAEPEYWDWLARLETIDSEITQERSTDIVPSRLQKAVQIEVFFNMYLEPSNDNLACSVTCRGSIFMALRVSVEMKYVTRKCPSPSKADLLSIFELLRNILTKVAISEAEGLWLMYCCQSELCNVDFTKPHTLYQSEKRKILFFKAFFHSFELLHSASEYFDSLCPRMKIVALKFFSNHKHFFDKLVDISLVSLAKDGGSENGFCLSSAIVNFVLQKDGIQSAREMYKRYVLALPRPGLPMYKICIELELNLAAINDKDCLVNARKLFESALTTYDQDINLWQDYYSMEIKMGTSETAAAVHWRARKKLKDAAALIGPAQL